MHTALIGQHHGLGGVQHGCPSREEGRRLIWFESPRWRPKRTSPRWSRGRLQFKKGRMMRTSPRWTRRHHGLPQVATRLQLSCHVTLGFSRHVITVSAITSSYDIETGRSWMRWKGDNDAVILDLVQAPDGSWIILCDHGKVLRHLFWANLAMYRVGP